jgi:hypothetical protein
VSDYDEGYAAGLDRGAAREQAHLAALSSKEERQLVRDYTTAVVAEERDPSVSHGAHELGQAVLACLAAKGQRAGLDGLMALARLGLKALACSRDGRDYEGADIQDDAADLDVIVAVKRTEPCGESCVCAEVSDPPFECYTNSPAVVAALAALLRANK